MDKFIRTTDDYYAKVAQVLSACWPRRHLLQEYSVGIQASDEFFTKPPQVYLMRMGKAVGGVAHQAEVEMASKSPGFSASANKHQLMSFSKSQPDFITLDVIPNEMLENRA